MKSQVFTELFILEWGTILFYVTCANFRGTYSESFIRRLLVLISSSFSKIIEFRIVSRFSLLCL